MLGRLRRILISAASLFLLLGFVQPYPSAAGTTTHTCIVLTPIDIDLLGLVVSETETEVRVEWLGKATSTLDCPAGDSADGLSVDVWEHAYYFWPTLPDDNYTAQVRGSARLRVVNPDIWGSGGLTLRGRAAGGVACSLRVCDVRVAVAARNADGARARLTNVGRVDLDAEEWLALRLKDVALRWTDAALPG